MRYNIETMTLEEKIAQLQGIWLQDLMDKGELSLEKCREKIPHGIGHICQFGSSNALDGQKLAQVVYQVQQFVQTETASKIPVLFHEEVINGVAAKGSTVTPQMLGLACSFDPELVKQNAHNAGESIKQLGGYYALSPMMDIITDARWARGEEGFGEDSYVVSAFADAFITGLQDMDVGATAKHYAGYGVENQEESFFINETLAPFEVAIRKSNVSAIMPGYHKFRGVPATCSEDLLVDALREHLGFEGVVVSDYNAITNIHRNFGYTDDATASAIASIKASVDVDLPQGGNYQTLIDAVRSGAIEESYIDAALGRVLGFKEKMMPSAPTLCTNVELDPPAHRADARNAARNAIVLLKNNGILPLDPNSSTHLLVTGPNADSYYSLLGDYSWGGLAEFFRSIPNDRLNPHLYTLLDGLKGLAGDAITLDFARGFSWVEGDTTNDISSNQSAGDARTKKANRQPLEVTPETDFDAALSKAAQSDIILAAVGENRYLCGEGTSRDDVHLPGEQETYVQQLIDTGKPVILCVFGGRPMAIAALAKQCAAVLYAWYPGEEGGNACAEILFGQTNPTAKLAVTIPDTNEDVPVHWKDEGVKPMFPFGFGLSYTNYTYNNFAVAGEVSTSDASFVVDFTVTNTGNYDGAEITQFYFENVHTKQKKLLGFAKTPLHAGETKHGQMRFFLDQFGLYEDGTFVVRPATQKLTIGSSSVIPEFTQEITLVGDVIHKDKRTTFLSEYHICTD